MLTIRQRPCLTHSHAGIDATCAADNARDPTVVSLCAERQFTRVDGVNRHDHPGFNLQFRSLIAHSIDIKVFGKIRATGNFQ